MSRDRHPQGWLKTGRVIAWLILLLPAGSQAQIPYISPGLQIGYSPDRGVSFSAQATLGLFIEVPYPVEFTIPGVTIGRRWGKQETMTFLDAQLAYLVFGAGIGKVWVKKGGQDLAAATGHRFKVWGGYFLNLTYDRYRIRDGAPNHHFGMIGVFPVPLIVFGALPLGFCV